MLYNIMTVCDSAYFVFGKILINSILDKCDLNKINSIYIINNGLDQSQCDYFYNKSNQIKIITTENKTNFKGGTWGEDWVANVRSKTVFLHKIIEETKQPVLMLDSDMMVIKDLSILMNLGGDIQVCLRPGHKAPYIGSYFFALDYNKSLLFVNEWVKLIGDKMYKEAFESSRLEETIKIFKKNKEFKITEIDQFLVNVIEPKSLKDNTVIAHFKGCSLDSNVESTFLKRIKIRGWDSYVKPYLD